MKHCEECSEKITNEIFGERRDLCENCIEVVCRCCEYADDLNDDGLCGECALDKAVGKADLICDMLQGK